MFKKFLSISSPQEIVLDGVFFILKHSLKKNMKRMIIRVEKKHEIRLSSARVSKKNLLHFIEENKSWILEQHQNILETYPLESSFYYLNKAYKVKHHTKNLELQENIVFMNPLKAKEDTDNFYKKQAKAYLPARVELWSKEMNLSFNKLGFRLAKKRWGSCNSKRNISLNPYMMKLSYEMIDYIIVHELSHLVHLNHSKQFYQTIEAYLPQYKAIEKEIKAISTLLR